MCGGGRFTVNLVCLARTPPRPTPCGEGVGRPRRLHPSARTAFLHRRRCHPLGPDVSTCVWICSPWQHRRTGTVGSSTNSIFRGLLFIRLNTVFTSCGRRQWNLLEFHARSLADGEICEVRRLFADGFVCEGLHCDPILCACWHDGSETVVLKTLRATLSGSCPDSTASNAVHSDSRLLQYENPRRFPHH